MMQIPAKSSRFLCEPSRHAHGLKRTAITEMPMTKTYYSGRFYGLFDFTLVCTSLWRAVRKLKAENRTLQAELAAQTQAPPLESAPATEVEWGKTRTPAIAQRSRATSLQPQHRTPR